MDGRQSNAQMVKYGDWSFNDLNTVVLNEGQVGMVNEHNWSWMDNML